MFGNLLNDLVLILLFIVLLGFINEMTLKLPTEIALMLYALIVGIIFLIVDMCSANTILDDFRARMHSVSLDDFLMHGVLCFMLFAGSCRMRKQDFRKSLKLITSLSLLTTLAGALFYGFLFYGVVYLLKLPLTLPMCLLFGSIVAPTDPIAATSILPKFGLPKETGFVIQGESLFNDGVGVALYVCFKSMLVKSADHQGFFQVMFRELFGAAAVGIIISLLLFQLFRTTHDEYRQISISLLAVASAYLICEYFGFSGAIASVICGITFGTETEKYAEKHNVPMYAYHHFWEILDTLLNRILYVMLGLSFLPVLNIQHIFLMSIICIAINLIARSASVWVSCLLCHPLPDNFKVPQFITILTWGGMRGGLCLALAMESSRILSNDAYLIIIACTYIVIFFTTIVQGLTMPIIYKKICPSVSE